MARAKADRRADGHRDATSLPRFPPHRRSGLLAVVGFRALAGRVLVEVDELSKNLAELAAHLAGELAAFFPLAPKDDVLFSLPG